MQETIAAQLYEAIRDALEQGWSINQIAAAAGVPQPSLQDWYSGRRNSLALQTVCALCAHFGMRLTKPVIKKPPHSSGEVREPRRKPKAKTAKPKGRRSKSKRK